jgi:hypothetical protein
VITARTGANKLLSLILSHYLSLPYETRVVLSDEFKTEVPEPPGSHMAVNEALIKRPEVQAQVTKIKVTELTYSSITMQQ